MTTIENGRLRDTETLILILKVQIEKEIADIFNYLLKLTDMLDIDLEKAALNKIDENDAKYPVEKFKGISKKYNK